MLNRNLTFSMRSTEGRLRLPPSILGRASLSYCPMIEKGLP